METSTGDAGVITWVTQLASQAWVGSVGSQLVFGPGTRVATLSMSKVSSNVGSICAVTVKVTLPPGATVTCAPVMAPVPDVGVTVDPGVAVAVQEPGISPAGVAIGHRAVTGGG